MLALAVWWLPRFGIVFVGGWSMAPTFTPGDLAFYRRSVEDVRERDIVLVAPPGSGAFIHRVTAVQLDGALRTKGEVAAEPFVVWLKQQRALCTYKNPEQPLTPAAFRLVRLERVGTYALQPVWADGHATGIYSFDYLKKVGELSGT